ncbi:SDR family NAD(P)-dependent oxidoreductase [Chloroflexia bacterium SDU3-3]|nr:SDR family NAD(P)-dependent oxidoreductase [Chloroflexia bacterium SDU3-3]
MVDERDLHHTNMVFVGGTGGIGLAAAQAVARRGAAVLLVGRNAARGRAAEQAVRAAGGRDATWLPADISTAAGAARAAEQIGQWRPALHGLVHTATMFQFQRATTADGVEAIFASQYLMRYALDRLLGDLLAASGDGRIIHVVGKALPWGMPDIANLAMDGQRWSAVRAISNTHKLTGLHVQELRRRWAGRPITATLASVGATHTTHIAALKGWVWGLYRLIAVTPEVSAQNIVRLLAMADASAAHGAILPNPKRLTPEPLAYDAGLARQAWDAAAQLLAQHGLALPADEHAYAHQRGAA